jgi:hypothetical protein
MNMQHKMLESDGTVVYLRPRDARAARWRGLCRGLGFALRRVGRFVGGAFWLLWIVAFQVVRMVLAALMVLTEPLVRLLVPFAFLLFLTTLIAGFLMETPNFPKWGMLGLSVGSLCAYWLYVMLMMVVIGGRRRDR